MAIFIDGLDESEGHDIQEEMLRAIRTSYPDQSIPLRFFVTSRPEPHLRESPLYSRGLSSFNISAYASPFFFVPMKLNNNDRLAYLPAQQFAYHETSFFIVRLLQNFSNISLASAAQPAFLVLNLNTAEASPLGWKNAERLTVKCHLTLLIEVASSSILPPCARNNLVFIKGGLWVSMEGVGGNETEAAV
ncbi:hypothetical protein B0H16DRAFT_1452312 [Mycena metata]|uniref:NACHT domain-containing protein n=1 Tax=Mycena metata TaxID=1033252 RepID=A0AAD7JQQ4_9AGAR|nr:hypothetical protein B0H16DRAFT_1452312 [Mycena metata]